MSYTILAIDPGSTSTKVALFKDEQLLFEMNLSHTNDELSSYSSIADQFEWRQDLIIDRLNQEGFNIEDITAVIGRGGLVKPIEGGVYEINDALWHDTKHAKMEHACNLGALIARAIADQIGVRSFIADPVVMDEMIPEARISGLPECPRLSIFHALNTREIARVHAKKVGSSVDKLNLIIAHLGGGVTVSTHQKGRVIDTTCGLGGDGSFSPERSGRLATSALVEMCFSGEYTKKQMQKFITGKGGFMAHLGTTSILKVLKMIEEGSEKAKLIMDAFCYNVSKDIGSMATVLSGRVDAVLVTGGIARSNYVVESIRSRCSFIAPVHIYPGENELESLAHNLLAVLRGVAEVKVYK